MLGKICFFCLAFFIFVKSAFAAPPVILSYPQNIKVSEEFTISATMSGLTKNGTYRLRIALSLPGSHSYFGSTEGYNGTPSPIDYTKFKTITSDVYGSWFGDIKGKVENSDPNYKDKNSNTFDLKLGRYTESGTSATWSEIVKVNLENPNSPTPSPAEALAKAGKIKPTPEKTISLTPTSTPIIQISPISQIASTPNPGEYADSENILATHTALIKNTPIVEADSISKDKSKAKYFFGFGALIFVVLFLSLLRKYRKGIIKQ